MRDFKDWSIRYKLLVPLTAMALISALAIAGVFLRAQSEIQADSLPGLNAIGQLRDDALALTAAYQAMVIHADKDRHFGDVAALKARIREERDNYARIAGNEEQEAHFVVAIDDGMARLTELGDETVALRREVARSLENDLEASADDLDKFLDELESFVGAEFQMALRDGDVEEIREFSLPEFTALQGLRVAMRDYLSELTEFILEPNPRTLEEIIELRAQIATLSAAFMHIARHNPEEREYGERLVELTAAYTAIGASVLDTDMRFAEKFNALEAAAYSLLDVLNKAHDVSVEESNIVLEQSIMFVLIAIAAMLAVTLALTWAVSGAVIKPVNALSRVATRFGGGDHGARANANRRDEIGHLGAAFNDMAAELRAAQEALVRSERLAAIGQVAATVGHELRNPLGAIRSALDVVGRLARDEDPMLKESLEISGRGIARCDAIINDLLDFTRERRLNREPTDIDSWLRKVVNECGVPEPMRLELESEVGIEMPLDRERLRRVFVNVIDNARQAMHENEPAGDRPSTLTVRAQVRGERLEIMVQDTGHGMAPEVVAKAFEPLYSTKSFGVGLGLPMVERIMAQHSGGVEVTSREGIGTEVILWLPLFAEIREDAA